MALANYTDLQAEVVDWLKDSALTAKVGSFIALIEAQFNRELRTSEMEAFTTLTTMADGTAGLPGDFLEVKTIWIGDYVPLSNISLAELRSTYASALVDRDPEAYTIVGALMNFGPAPSEATDLSMVYYQKIPNLSEAVPTNWLMAAHPDVYLYGALLMAEARGWNDERLPMIEAKFESVMDSITKAGVKKRYGGGPLVPRSNVRQMYGARS